MLVEVIVERRNVDVHVRVLGLHHLHALGSADDAHELDVLAADFLHELHRSRCAAAGGEHGVDNDDVTLGDIGRHLEVILHRLERLRVAEQADVTDLDVRHHGDHAVDHAETGAEDRHDGQLLAGDVPAVCRGDRGLDIDLLKREVARSLEAHQHGDLGNQFPELLDAGVLVAQDRELVLDQRVVKNVNFTHLVVSFVASVFYLQSFSASAASRA